MKNLCVITGAGSGIGRATALLFHQNNWEVFLVGRDIDHLQETQKLCGPGAQVHYKTCDITKEQEIRDLVTVVERIKFESLCLVNNAGIYIADTPETEIDIWREHFTINLFGAVLLTQGLLPLMIQKNNNSIVNVSSTLGLKPVGPASAYSASKAAMNSWTQSLALSIAERGIRVNAVCPGLVDTPIHPFHSQESSKKLETLKKMGPMQPLGRIGTPEEIAKSIYFLASEDSGWTTGALLSVDGGINLT